MCLGLEQNVAIRQQALQEVVAKVIKVGKKCLNSMEDIEHYHPMLIDIKEQY
jgi:hypothetical protein